MIHREGYSTIGLTLLILLGSMLLLEWLAPSLVAPVIIIELFVLAVVLQFFRNPSRIIEVEDDGLIYAPADGKVVVIEEIIEEEYFRDKRKKIAIFMSPFNVHVNRIPIGGIIKYYKYHHGKYLVAWHPKSSTENERTTTVISTKGGEILMRQIAGALAKRIVHYCPEDKLVVQGEEMGFIKFGSRVDVYLPLGSEICINIDQKVIGNKTVIAKWKV